MRVCHGVPSRELPQPDVPLPARPSSLQGRQSLYISPAASSPVRAFPALAAQSQSPPVTLVRSKRTPSCHGRRMDGAAAAAAAVAPHLGLAAGEGEPHGHNDATGGATHSGGATMGSMTGWQALADQARPPRMRVPCRD